MKRYRLAAIAAAAVIALSGYGIFSVIPPAISVSTAAAGKLDAPSVLTSEIAGNTLRLSWKNVSSASAYRVFRYDTESRKYVSFRTTKKTSVSVSDLPAGSYKFRVAALVRKNGKYYVQAKSSPVFVTIKEEKMTDRITVNTQSSIRIDCSALVIRIDPFRISDELHDADVILITHAHYDHYSPDDIRKVCKPDTVIAAPKSMKKQLADDGFTNTVLLDPGEKTDIRGIPVEAVKAYNVSKSFHPKSNNWLGYIVTALGSRIYAAGDTDATPEAQNVKCDIALVPIGGTYTMNAEDAAALVNAIKPGACIPIHYGSIVGSRADGNKFAKLVDKNINVVLKL